MLGWIAKTWEYGTATENVLPTEYPQTEYAQTQQESRRSTPSRTLDDIIIEGSDLFVNHVNRCFEEIRDTKWEFTVAQVRKIIQISSGAHACVSTSSKGSIESSLQMLGCGTWSNDYIEGAATLLHEAVHAIRISNDVFDYTYYSAEERLAFKYEAEFLRYHGRNGKAAQVESADGRHGKSGMSAELLALQRR
jgi:hypothetical protein